MHQVVVAIVSLPLAVLLLSSNGTANARAADLASRTFAAQTAKQKCINSCRARYRDCRRLDQLPSPECRGVTRIALDTFVLVWDQDDRLAFCSGQQTVRRYCAKRGDSAPRARLEYRGVVGMDSSFGVLDAFAFVVFAVLIFVGVAIVVSLGQLPGQLARKWDHPQAAAVNAASWIGIATGGVLWPLAFIWAFITPPTSARPPADKEDRQS
jgi:hypothetical protein